MHGVGDRGAVAVIVAVLLASGLLLGMGAYVVDIGAMHAEREQLQTGADAAAVALAQACAKGLDTCASDLSATGIAGTYGNRNANDGNAGVTTVCGSGDPALVPCADAAGTVSDCVTARPASGTNYVEVRLHTRVRDGSTLLPPAFAGVAIDGYRGATLGACARAAWGPPRWGSALAVTLSLCEWDTATQHGFPTQEQAVLLHNSQDHGACPPNGHSGADAPGAFGWVQQNAGPCMTRIGDGTYRGDVGNGIPANSGCRSVLPRLRASGQPVLVPVYNDVNGNGGGGQNGVTYTLEGFAAFVVTGWHLPGFSSEFAPADRGTCQIQQGAGGGQQHHGQPGQHGGDTCIFGYFVQELVPYTGAIGGPAMGATIVALIG